MCCIFCVITTILHMLTRSRIQKTKKPVNEVFCQIFHLLTHDPPWIIRPMAICEAIMTALHECPHVLNRAQVRAIERPIHALNSIFIKVRIRLDDDDAVLRCRPLAGSISNHSSVW